MRTYLTNIPCESELIPLEEDDDDEEDEEEDDDDEEEAVFLEEDFLDERPDKCLDFLRAVF